MELHFFLDISNTNRDDIQFKPWGILTEYKCINRHSKAVLVSTLHKLEAGLISEMGTYV